MKDIFTPSLIWDLALIALILFVVIRSVGRGFVSSFIHLLGLAASCIVAALLSGKAPKQTPDELLFPVRLIDAIDRALESGKSEAVL